jgi:signal transduction histidine kinase
MEQKSTTIGSWKEGVAARLRPRSAILRYAVALLLGLGALALGHFLPAQWNLKVPLMAVTSLLIAFSAWLGGLGPGLVTTALCTVAAADWLPPPGSLSVREPAEITGLAIYGAVGVALSFICEQRRAAIKTSELEHGGRSIRDEIMQIVARDLTDPLVTIDGSAELLEHAAGPGEEGDTLRKRAVTIHRSVARIRRMLLDLLDARALETGDLSLRPSLAEPGNLLREVAELYSEEAEARSVEVTLKTAPSMPTVSADHDRVLQVLSHLTNLAIRFASSGGQVTLNANPQDGFTRFSVHEHGADERLHVSKAVFHDSIENGGPDSVRLSLARKIVEAHGGRFQIESEGRRGSTFAFTLPNG